MRHSLPRAPQFYVTAPQECPYLDNKIERKLFTSLNGPDALVLNNALSQQGFRRSQNVLYRPSCSECSSCLSARIPVSNFTVSKSQKRVIKRNSALIREKKTPMATDEQYTLFQKYVSFRHSKGGMATMDAMEFSSMIEETSVDTILCEYSFKKNNGDIVLAAVSLTDVLNDGLSMVYSFYDPDLSYLSLGKYMILDHVNLVKELALSYLYLGYWVKGSSKMDYKAQYKPLEVFKNGQWLTLETSTEYSTSSTNTMELFAETDRPIFLPESQDKTKNTF